MPCLDMPLSAPTTPRCQTPDELPSPGPFDATKMISSSSSVKVVAVVRPLLPFEVEAGARDIVQVMPPGNLQLPKKPNGTGTEESYPFSFDKVVRADSPLAHRDIRRLVTPVIERYCQGFNASVLAYGQTGSGKTYTMGSNLEEKDFLAPEPRGVIPAALKLLFAYCEKAAETYDITLTVQYVEIYNEHVNDLLASLNPEHRRPSVSGLEIREKSSGDIFIDGVTEIQVTRHEEIAALLDQGNTMRSIAAHLQNDQSSRSHAIVTITLEQRAKVSAAPRLDKGLRYLRSKLHLVDLAGSERIKQTGSSGARLTEGVSINKGLLELGNVIVALTQGAGRSHVPYRNSKLTRLLADSLGGNSETLFIACLSPADSNHDPTLSTLRYAQRARKIRNQLVLNNKMTQDEELEYLRGLVLTLQMEVGKLKCKLAEKQGEGMK